MLPPQTGNQNPDGEDRQIRKRGAEIRLFFNQQHGQKNKAGEPQQVPRLQAIALQFGQIFRYQQDNHDLKKLRDLELEHAEANPSAGTQHARAKQRDDQ